VDLGFLFRYELVKGESPLNIVVRWGTLYFSKKVCGGSSVQEVLDSHGSFSLNFRLISTA